MAECHPVGFRWVMKAKERGATVIHIDPRFTRTSAVADLHVPIRAGSDIVLLGALIRYAIENQVYFRDYVVGYTNAANIVCDAFRDTEDLDGLFSGWDPERRQYDQTTWALEPGRVDPTLTDPRCVFQVLRRHFARYTPDKVEEVCGIPPALFLRVAQTISRNSGRDRTTAFCYSVGWTQHTAGVQFIRTAAILQTLLGNMGRPGGGILALRGHASIQGSTDIPTLFNLLPGYLPMPEAGLDTDFDRYVARNGSATGWWSEFRKYAVSLMKAWFGDAAQPENGWRFDWLPLINGDHSHMTTVSDMADGKVRGYFVMGENPVVGSMNGHLQGQALGKLQWLVVRDFVRIETAEFWRDDPENIPTEVFFFPAAAHTEKKGTFTNTQRLLQWHEAAVEPEGDSRSELHFVYHLGRRLREIYRHSTSERDLPLKNLTWDYPVKGPHDEPEAEAVLKEINGYDALTGRPLDRFTELRDDGSTVSGCWIYTGSYAGGINQTARRKPAGEQNWVAPEWGWSWPANRRILYNRASADPQGRPWSERKKYVWWNEEARTWEGFDVPDFILTRPPSYRPPAGARGLEAIAGDDPFLMKPDGKAWLFAPTGLVDGPLPAHYEPFEGVVKNALYARQMNPSHIEWNRPGNAHHRPFGDPRFPYLVTTYRLTEHHTAGGMSRWLGWLAELQPEMFCEVSPELACERGLTNRGWATIRTARAEIEARVLVTARLRPIRMKGRVVHQIGLPYHWGSRGLVRGDAANNLIAFAADPNAFIQESKVFTADIQPGRRTRESSREPVS